MGKHSEWRKLVKKLRRKRIRQQIACSREESIKKAQLEREQLPGYQEWLQSEANEEEFRKEEEQRIHDEQEAKWLATEKIAQKQWAELQNKLARLREERVQQNARIKEEWEQEQKKLKELEELKKKEVENKIKEQEQLKKEISNFVDYGGNVPEQLEVQFESNPGKMMCPFFSKTSACRFGNACSRNHVRPGISKIILIPNFYSHYSLTQSENEHGSSILEFEHSELYEHFREFFFDVIPEMEKIGRIKKFIVCCNGEAHLRGNVYVEYSSPREAVKAYETLNGRWYAGKQLSVQFCGIPNWSAAICGLFDKQICPKGSSCNFIHKFYNPKYSFNGDKMRNSRQESDYNDRRYWRWSESPEHNILSDKEWEDQIEISDEHAYVNSKRHRRKYSTSERNSARSRRSSRSRKNSSTSRRSNSSSRRNTSGSRSSSRSKRSCTSSRHHRRSRSRSHTRKRKKMLTKEK